MGRRGSSGLRFRVCFFTVYLLVERLTAGRVVLDSFTVYQPNHPTASQEQYHLNSESLPTNMKSNDYLFLPISNVTSSIRQKQEGNTLPPGSYMSATCHLTPRQKTITAEKSKCTHPHRRVKGDYHTLTLPDRCEAQHQRVPRVVPSQMVIRHPIHDYLLFHTQKGLPI